MKKSKKKRKSSAETQADDEEGDWHRVAYTVFVQSPTGVLRITVNSDVTTQKMNDPAEYMMNKTRKAITDKINDYGIDCSIGAGPLFMEMDGYWRYLWVYAEREISNDKLASESKSAASRKGHQTRAEKIEAKEWEIGDGFKDAAAKHQFSLR